VERSDRGEREVTARALRVSLGADYRPFERLSPFWFGSAESSLQQRLDRRYRTGAGAKRTFYREGEDDISAATARGTCRAWEGSPFRQGGHHGRRPRADRA
jgi:hypothetical protein